MLRRIGYALGLLFVLACVAAWATSYGRVWVGSVTVARFTLDATHHRGRFVLALWRPPAKGLGITIRHDDQAADLDRLIPRDEWFMWRAMPSTNYRIPIIAMPILVPAAATILFMAWRRRRTRRPAGFPMAEISDSPVGG